MVYKLGAKDKTTVEMKRVCIELTVQETVNVKTNIPGMVMVLVFQIEITLILVNHTNSNSNTP